MSSWQMVVLIVFADPREDTIVPIQCLLKVIYSSSELLQFFFYCPRSSDILALRLASSDVLTLALRLCL
jgi:hypothetical protein